MPGKLGSQTRNITCNVHKDVWLEIHKLARISGVSVSQYAGTVLEDAAKKGVIVRETREYKQEWYDAVDKGAALPKRSFEVVPPGELRKDAGTKYVALRAAEPPAGSKKSKRR